MVVRFDAPAVREILEAAAEVVQFFAPRMAPVAVRPGEEALVLFVTSAFEGAHAEGSRHYRDEAVDFGTSTFTSRQAKRDFRLRLAQRLGPTFTVILENEGAPGEHLHVQVRKGLTYPSSR